MKNSSFKMVAKNCHAIDRRDQESFKSIKILNKVEVARYNTVRYRTSNFA